MAEKKVSVRAELEGIGEAGARGFGRLSSEMELANTRLASFARRAGIALAMVRSGLANIDAQAKLAQSMRTTVESIQTLTWAGELAGVSLGEIEQATKKLTTRPSEAASESGAAVGALHRAGGGIGQAIAALFDNLGRLATYAATFAAVMAGRWAAGMAAAALSVRGLATALALLRGALIVGAGELSLRRPRQARMRLRDPGPGEGRQGSDRHRPDDTGHPVRRATLPRPALLRDRRAIHGRAGRRDVHAGARRRRGVVVEARQYRLVPAGDLPDREAIRSYRD